MSNTTDKIQQTVENTRYVFASTDMTAIYSFITAAVIGIVVALIGVFLAWWYGKKSFDLTTQSFQTTIEQIRASIDSAKNNTALVVNSAKNAHEREVELKRKELIFHSRQAWLNDLRDTSVLFTKSLDELTLLHSINKSKIKAGMSESYVNTFVEKISRELVNINSTALKVELLFNPEGDDEKEIIKILGSIRDIVSKNLSSCLDPESEVITKLTAPYHVDFKNRMVSLLKKEWEKTKQLE